MPDKAGSNRGIAMPARAGSNRGIAMPARAGSSLSLLSLLSTSIEHTGAVVNISA
jgi:hypothetical protein